MAEVVIKVCPCCGGVEYLEPDIKIEVNDKITAELAILIQAASITVPRGVGHG